MNLRGGNNNSRQGVEEFLKHLKGDYEALTAVMRL